MYKIAAIIGGVLLMAGVALAGTVSSLGSPSSPTIGQTIPTAGTTVRQEDRAAEAEARGRANEAGEDVSGPCDEAEHANDPRCTGAAPAPPPLTTTTAATTTAAPARPAPAATAARTTAATPGHGRHGGDD